MSSTCTAPAFMVFGDEAYTAETAEDEALSSGLTKLAASEGATVVFINPQGETWSEADVGVYTAMIDMYSDSSTDTFVNGIAESLNWMTGATDTKILGGYQSRIYLYAEGSSAEWILDNYSKISGAYRSQVGQILPMHDYAAEGIVESVEHYTLSGGVTIGYVVYYGSELAVTDSANLWWSVNGQAVYQVTDKVAFKDSTLTVNLFKSADGRYYTALADASNQSHEVYARNSWAAESGIARGDGVFAPLDVCTRADIVAFLYRAEDLAE